MSLLLSAQGLTKSFGPRPLFADLALDLRAGERIGLIGPNGAGKSTLLKILAGLEVTDAGERSARRGARIGYLPQEDTFPDGLTAREVLLDALQPDPMEDYERETAAAITLTQVGFEDHDQPHARMSGGWRKRLALARELVRKPDLLLLDEPTNHLDLPGVVWLERLLRSSPFGYLAATHDRAFLRAVADEIVEISRVYPAGVFRVAGHFDDFADKREAFLDAQARAMESVANVVRKETEWLGRKAAARTRKASSRIEAAGARREELAELQYRTATGTAAGIDFQGTGRQTRKLIAATAIGKTLGDKKLFGPTDLLLSPGTKLGLLGANGSGKSTLLKVLSGTLDPDTGTVVRADGLRIVVFEQGRAALDQTLTLHKALCPNGDTVTFGDRQLHVAAWAQRFLFRAELLNLQLSALSGGEQARVRIAQLMTKPADVLFLDEPTNDLDIPSLEVLEDSLAEFPGAVVLVTHDRDLMDRLCTEVIGLDGKGGAAPYGNVSQWLTAHERATAEAAKPTEAAKPKPVAQPKARKLSFKEKQEFEGMETAILAAETAVAAREAEVQAASNGGHAALAEACRTLEDAQKTVEKLYARWQELEAKAGGG